MVVGPLSYRVVGSGQSLAAFYVDTVTGGTAAAASDPAAVGVLLRTTIELDREVCDTYHVVVQIDDDAPHSDLLPAARHTDPPPPATEVVVMVTDVNDNAPSFPQFPPTHVREGTI